MTTSVISQTIKDFETLISNSTNFQTWVGATGTDKATDAKKYIHTHAYQLGSRPFCLITMGTAWQANKVGEINSYFCSGNIEILFEQLAKTNSTESQVCEDFLDNIGNIIEDILALSGTSGYVAITSISLMDIWRPHETEVKTYGDIIQAKFSIDWA